MPHLSSAARGRAHVATQPGPGCGMVSEVLSPGLLDQEGGDPLQRQSAQGGVNAASRIPYTCLQDLSLGSGCTPRSRSKPQSPFVYHPCNPEVSCPHYAQPGIMLPFLGFHMCHPAAAHEPSRPFFQLGSLPAVPLRSPILVLSMLRALASSPMPPPVPELFLLPNHGFYSLFSEKCANLLPVRLWLPKGRH